MNVEELRQLIESNSQQIKKNNDAIAQLTIDLDKTAYKFTAYQQSSERLLSLATTVIVAASSVAILPSAINAIVSLVNDFVTVLGAK